MLPETAKNAVFMPWRMLIRWAKDAQSLLKGQPLPACGYVLVAESVPSSCISASFFPVGMGPWYKNR